MSFELDINNFIKKAKVNADLAVRGIVAGVAESVIEMSPVGDAVAWKSKPPKGYLGGRFRGNWDYGLNNNPRAEYDVIDKSGGMSTQRINGKLPARASGHVHFIANNLPYAQRLEDGYSKQAPAGMIGLTVVKYQSIVADALRKLPK